MIPFGIKILFFVLSLTGLVCSWLVLIPFGRAVGAMWGPGGFCIGNLILQVIFCLGLIWRMDPFLMPKGFCVAQTLIIAFADFFLTGVAGAFSMATSLAVLKPRGWGDNTALKWRSVFLIPVVVFPIVATIVHAVIIVKFDSVKPTDDLHCDSTDPEWARFFGYAGVPMIVSLPCTFLSVKSLIVIWKANQKIQRTNRSLVFESVGGYTSLPPRSLKHGSVSILMKDPEPTTSGYHPASLVTTPISGKASTPSFLTAYEYPPSPQTTASLMLTGQSSSPVEKKFHLPFRPPPVATPVIDSYIVGHRGRALREGEEDISDVSPTIPTFGPPLAQADGFMGNEARGRRKQPAKVERDAVWVDRTVESDVDAAGLKTGMRDDTSEVLGEVNSADATSGRYMTPMEFVSQPSMTEAGTARSSPSLAPAIWRIILFQTAFCIVQLLACISTIVDLATHRATPTPVGTQHFALLLAAWGPVIIFGHTPAVRKSLKFWGNRN